MFEDIQSLRFRYPSYLKTAQVYPRKHVNLNNTILVIALVTPVTPLSIGCMGVWQLPSKLVVQRDQRISGSCNHFSDVSQTSLQGSYKQQPLFERQSKNYMSLSIHL